MPHNRIRILRERIGKSQRGLGTKIYPEISPDAGQKLISRIEAGKREIFAEELYRFASYFGVSPDWLMFGDAAPPRSDGSEPGWTEDLRSLCRDVKLIMESGDHVTAMALRQNIAAFKESVIRKTQIDGERENKGLASRKDPLSIPSPQDEENESPGRKKAI